MIMVIKDYRMLRYNMLDLLHYFVDNNVFIFVQFTSQAY